MDARAAYARAQRAVATATEKYVAFRRSPEYVHTEFLAAEENLFITVDRLQAARKKMR